MHKKKKKSNSDQVEKIERLPKRARPDTGSEEDPSKADHEEDFGDKPNLEGNGEETNSSDEKKPVYLLDQKVKEEIK